MLFYLLLIATTPFLSIAFPQDDSGLSAGTSSDESNPVSPNGKDGSTTMTYDECTNKCPETPDKMTVCGTDNANYTNMAQLNCAQTCGKAVRLAYPGSCRSTTQTG